VRPGRVRHGGDEPGEHGVLDGGGSCFPSLPLRVRHDESAPGSRGGPITDRRRLQAGPPAMGPVRPGDRRANRLEAGVEGGAQSRDGDDDARRSEHHEAVLHRGRAPVLRVLVAAGVPATKARTRA